MAAIPSPMNATARMKFFMFFLRTQFAQRQWSSDVIVRPRLVTRPRQRSVHNRILWRRLGGDKRNRIVFSLEGIQNRRLSLGQAHSRQFRTGWNGDSGQDGLSGRCQCPTCERVIAQYLCGVEV